MKKVSNINLGSVVFAIEQDAYDALASYIEAIKTNLGSTEDVSEVVADVERAIAEKFLKMKRSEKSAVTTTDVGEVMSEIGSPADFGDGQTSETPESAPADGEATEAKSEAKRWLYRDKDDAVIAGIASGLAQYFEIDPVIVRLIFVISIFFNGLGLLVYIILWLVVPAATTTTDKYAMRGERMTLKDISQRVKKNLASIDEQDRETAKGVWAKVRGVLDTSFRVLGTVLRGLATLARYLGGIILVIAGALGIAGLVSTYSVILLSDKVFFPADVQLALDTMMGSAIGIVAMLSSFIMMTIPLIVLVVAGASLLAKRNYFTVQKSVALVVVWIVAFAVAGTTSALQVEQVMQKIGPIEGHFNKSEFKLEWEGGRIYGNEDEVWIYRDVPEAPSAVKPVTPSEYTQELIVVDAPQPQTAITSPLTVSGIARGYWFFEGSFPLIVTDWDGRIIGEGFATADGEWMTEDFVPFIGTVSFDLPEDTPYLRGSVIFQKSNPAGLSAYDHALEIPVTFE